MADLSKMTAEEKAALIAALTADAAAAAAPDLDAAKQVYLEAVEKVKQAKSAYEAAICKLKSVEYVEGEFNIMAVCPNLATEMPEVDLIMVSLATFVGNDVNHKGRFEAPAPEIPIDLALD